MNPFKTLLSALLLTVALAACQKPSATNSTAEKQRAPAKPGEAAKGDAVTFKEGHGLSFHPKIMQSMGLKVAEVAETPVAPEFTAQLHVIGGAGGFQRVAFTPGATGKSEASGWLMEEKAKRLQPGQEVELRSNGSDSSTAEKGVVKRVEKAAFAALGEYEVVVETDAPFASGTRVNAAFRAPAGDAVPAVPRSALLKTVEGWFVYAVNESFYLRTPVKVGAMNDELAEITDGLYAGDQIVTAPVNSLWMAELQIIRGGKSCTCGQ